MAGARDRHGRESARGAPYLYRTTVSGSRSGRSFEAVPSPWHLTLPTGLYRRNPAFDPRRHNGASPRASLPLV